MMTRQRTQWTAALLALMASMAPGLAAPAAPAVTLKVGDAAPKLQTGKWAQGTPVKEFAPGKAYLVEFWATWCGPCRVSIPHLNELHTKYQDKGLVVIGQDVWEQDESKVEPFVKQMGAKMTYRVAFDDKDGSERGKMADTWMTAAGRRGIPSAFLVDTKGFLAWIGHPMQLEESVIESVLAGTFDVKKAAAADETRVANEEKLTAARRELSTAMRSKDWEAAEARFAEIEKLTPADEREALALNRFNLHIAKKDYKGAYAYAEMFAEAHPKNARMLNALAWGMVSRKDIEEKNHTLAEKLANRANDAAQGKDPMILDTLARALFVNGKKDQAIAAQEKALELAGEDGKKSMQQTLDSYKAGKLPGAGN